LFDLETEESTDLGASHWTTAPVQQWIIQLTQLKSEMRTDKKNYSTVQVDDELPVTLKCFPFTIFLRKLSGKCFPSKRIVHVLISGPISCKYPA